MPLETTLHYTPDLVRHAVLRFWRRSVGLRTVLVTGAMLLWLGVLLAQGDRSWQVGVVGTAVAISVLVGVMVYAVHYRNAMAKLRAMGGMARAALRADENGFTLQSEAGLATLPWSSVKEVWQFERVWLLLFSPAQFSTLPVADLPPEMQALIEARVRAAGGKIQAKP
ncbi:hypothetical protein HNP48_001149 [Acidovorax soli]|uniref:YcxB-like C-terminal domain-containing protein n=1 Tax=Acidovorax soli TaxID=592050 RepID=A0A7X0PAT4_9BURK|nr:YcxB family protein [Acidovorax soli]MBB6558485.1 hypothetical protein [Acidovorax soli]